MKKLAKKDMKKVKGGINECAIECRLRRFECLKIGRPTGVCLEDYLNCIDYICQL